MQQLPDRSDWHLISAEAALAALNSSEAGLGVPEARQRLVTCGPNLLQIEPRSQSWRRLLRQFHNVLLYVLMVSAGITALLGEWLDMSVILGVIVINALVGFIQEGRAERAMQALRRMLSPIAVVIREGAPADTDVRDLVPGDLVLLQAGDRVPADLRLLQSRDLEVDQSILTGESQAVVKHSAQLDGVVVLPDRSNMAYAGTLISRGRATGIVVATAGSTELGAISESLRSVARLTTPLLERISVFARWLSLTILLAAGAIGTFGALVHGHGLSDMLIAAVSIAVAAIPEGLPAVITITLAIGVQLMARRNAIVRRLPAVETLGEVDVICTDKTGTLTANQMMVRSVITADGAFDVSGGPLTLGGEIMPVDSTRSARPVSLRRLLLAAQNCSDATASAVGEVFEVTGDPTGTALAVLAVRAGLQAGDRLPQMDVLPFESERQFMASLHEDRLGGQVLFLKGAPERVFEMCATVLSEAGERPFESADWLDVAQSLAANGQRVLAFAAAEFSKPVDQITEAELSRGLQLLGVVGMSDAPRVEVPQAVRRCQAAGIDVKMITGDHPATAAAVAKELGLADRRVVTGAELDDLDDAALQVVAEESVVFARTSPAHKLRLVGALQARGHIVAMTGDGVNDAPALKRSNVGIAMGRKGTEAAREASDIVLADDNFATIVGAVEAGRNIDDTIRKSVLFLLPTSITEALAIALALLFGYELPMTPVQILWINMITAVTLGIALAFEPGSPAVMSRPPRSLRSGLVSGLVLWRIAFVSALMMLGIASIYFLASATESTGYARTAAVNTLVLFEALYLLSSRHLTHFALTREGLFGNRAVPLGILLVMGFQLLFTYGAGFQYLFESEPLSGATWITIGVAGLVLFGLVELEKWLRGLLLARGASGLSADPNGSII